MKKITALEISKNLPMRVRSLNEVGLFVGEVIRFHTVNEVGNLLGNVLGNKGKRICIINPNVEFELLENGE